MADVSLLDATRCRIVGGEVGSEMTVQTVLSLLEVARLRRGAFHGGLSFSRDRAPAIGPTSMPGGRIERPRGRAPSRAPRGSLRRSTGRAKRPHAGERERLLSSRARRRPGTGGLKGRLSPCGRDRVVVLWWWNPDSRLSRRPSLSETLSWGPEPTTSSGPPRQTTTPPAREDSTVRSLEGSLSEPISRHERPWPRTRHDVARPRTTRSLPG